MLEKGKRPLTSICIPTYNRADVLQNCLDSIVNNKAFCDKIEVYVGDNASTDSTEQLLREYSSRYPNVRYYTNPKNIGGERNFIKILETANGEFLKLHNDYSVFTENGLGDVLLCVEKYSKDRPLLFFDMDHKQSLYINDVTDSLDKIFMKERWAMSWIGSYGYWREDFLPLADKEGKKDTLFLQLDWFLRIFIKKRRCVICESRFSNRYPFKAKLGGYDFIKVHTLNFLGMFDPYVEQGLISKKTMSIVSKHQFHRMYSWIQKIKDDPTVYTYDMDHPYRTLYKRFHHYAWYYPLMAETALRLIKKKI